MVYSHCMVIANLQTLNHYYTADNMNPLMYGPYNTPGVAHFEWSDCLLLQNFEHVLLLTKTAFL